MLENEVIFNQPIWDEVSAECREFISNMLVKDPAQRPSIKEILSHPFFADFNEKTTLRLSLEI